MSQQMNDMRKSMAEDKQTAVLMAGLRGSNVDESDFADDSVVMQLVEVAHDDADQLPLAYDPERIADFWGRRPVAVIRRALQLWGQIATHDACIFCLCCVRDAYCCPLVSLINSLLPIHCLAHSPLHCSKDGLS